MAHKEPKISKQAVEAKTRDISLTLPKTLEIIWKPGSATNHSTIMAAYNIALLTTYGIKKHRGRITYRNLGQYRFCFINGIFGTLTPLQSHGCHIKLILLYQNSNFV
jgi:hypothetical protein